MSQRMKKQILRIFVFDCLYGFTRVFKSEFVAFFLFTKCNKFFLFIF